MSLETQVMDSMKEAMKSKDSETLGALRGIKAAFLTLNTSGKEITEDKLVKSFDTDVDTLSDIWKQKYAKPRIRQLQKKNNVSYETLFYDDLIFLSWEETKAKYLPQVGR